MQYKSNRPAIDKAIQAGIKQGLDAAGVHLQREIRDSLNGQSPSSPGNPPGRRTGTLAKSIQVDRSGNRGARPVVRVGTNLEYAPIHEFGGTITPKKADALKFKLPDGSWRTAKRVIMPARPFMRPTYNRNRKKMGAIFAGAVRRAVSKVKG